MSIAKGKIAAAPISWGVCEVPGWGLQMEPDRVLREMSELGFQATEFGPEGFLPIEPSAKAAILKEHGMVAVGGFVPVILHNRLLDPLPQIIVELEAYKASGARILVLAASTGIDGYDVKRPILSHSEWQIVFGNLARIQEVAAQVSVKAVLHPHVGTMVESEDDINRILQGSTIPFCLDTGHMLIGGSDPVVFSKMHADRIGHTHLKDVSLPLAKKVQAGEITYYDAVAIGLYRPLGQGDVNIYAIVKNLIAVGYDGWYTLEQDNIVTNTPAPSEGPISDARASVEFLRGILEEEN